MGLLDWCEEFDRQAHIAGDTERQQLFHYFQRHLQFRQHDTETALQIVTDGQQHALRLREPWWALFYELQRIHLLGMLYRYTEAMEATVRAVVEARKPEYDGLPQRVCIHEHLVSQHIAHDPMLHEERIEQSLRHIESHPRLELECQATLHTMRAWFALSLDRNDAAETAALQALQLTNAELGPNLRAYSFLLEVTYRRGDWETMRGVAEEAETMARHGWIDKPLHEFRMWRALVAQRNGEDRAGKRLFRQAMAIADRLTSAGALFIHALAAYHEVCGDYDAALKIRGGPGGTAQPIPPDKMPAWQECNIRIRRLQLLAHMGEPLEPTLSEVREAAQRMGVPAFMVAKVDRIEREVTRGHIGPPWSWQRGESYITY